MALKYTKIFFLNLRFNMKTGFFFFRFFFTILQNVNSRRQTGKSGGRREEVTKMNLLMKLHRSDLNRAEKKKHPYLHPAGRS